MLRQLGVDLGFVPLVIGASSTLYVLTLLASGPEVTPFSGGMNILVPSSRAMLIFGMSGAVPVFRDGAWWTLLSATWLHVPASLSSTTIPFGRSGSSAKVNVSVEPAYQMRSPTGTWKW